MSSDRWAQIIERYPAVRSKADKLLSCSDKDKKLDLLVDIIDVVVGNKTEGAKRRRTAANGEEEERLRLEVQMLQPRGRHLIICGTALVTLSPLARPDEVVVEASYDQIESLANLPSIEPGKAPSTLAIVFKEALQVARGTSRFLVAAYKEDEQVADAQNGHNFESLFSALSQVLGEAGVASRMQPDNSFKSSSGKVAVRCTVKANEGLLYPFRTYLFFGPKAFTCIRIDDVDRIEFAGEAAKSFSLRVVLKDKTKVEFDGIDRAEQSSLNKYIAKVTDHDQSGRGGASASSSAAGPSGSARQPDSLANAELPSEDESEDMDYDPQEEDSDGIARSDDDVLGEDAIPEKDSDSD